MSAVQPSIGPKAELQGLLSDARQLRDGYEAAFQQYKADSALNRILGSIGVRAAYEYFDVPKQVGRNAIKAILKEWEATPQYQGIRRQHEALMHRARSSLGGVSEVVPSLRRPGNSRRLLTKLRPVQDAVRLDTKVRRLITVPEDVEARQLTYNANIPEKPSRPPGLKKSSGRSTPSMPQAGEAWGVIGIAITIFLASLAFVPIIGWLWGFVTATGATLLSVVALIGTRRWWLPLVNRALATRSRSKTKTR